MGTLRFAHPTRRTSRLEVSHLRRGGEQTSARRPQFSVLVAIAAMEDPGVRDREHPRDILSREAFQVGVEIGRQRHRAERHQFAAGMEHPREERIRDRHQRKRIDLARRELIPFGTVSITTYFHTASDELAAEDITHVLAAADARIFHKSYGDQHGELWSPSGRLLATTTQIAYFKA